MSEEPRLWPAMLVAAIMVLSVASAMFVGTQNEPEVPGECQLTYYASAALGNDTVRGTLFVTLSGTNETADMNWDDGLWNNGSGPMMRTPWFGGSSLLDLVDLETPFGIKAVGRYITLAEGQGIAEGRPEIRVTYSGCGSHLTYREDVITPEYRASFVLAEVDFTEIFAIDQEFSGDEPWIGSPDYIETVTMDGTFDSDAVLTQDLHYTVNVTNYVHYYFGQENVLAMVEGGAFLYDQGRTVIGNGTLEFEATGDWFLRFVGPIGQEPHHLVMDVRAM